MRFREKQYHDSYRRNFVFAEYANNSDYWIELEYVVSRDTFASALGSEFSKSKALDINLLAENGEKIFRNAPSEIAARGYRLMKEEIRPANYDEDVYSVVETYGYVPAFSLTDFDSQMITYLGYTTNKMPTGLDRYTLAVEGHPCGNRARIVGARTGDLFYFGYNNQGWWGYMYSTLTSVVDDLGTVTVPAVYTKDKVCDDVGRTDYYWGSIAPADLPNGIKSLKPVLVRRIVRPVSKETAVEVRTEYFSTPPQVIRRSRCLNASGEEVNDTSQMASATLYQNRWVVEDSAVEREGNLYKRITKFLPAGEHGYLDGGGDIDTPPEARLNVYIDGELAGDIAESEYTHDFAVYTAISAIKRLYRKDEYEVAGKTFACIVGTDSFTVIYDSQTGALREQTAADTQTPDESEDSPQQ